MSIRKPFKNLTAPQKENLLLAVEDFMNLSQMDEFKDFMFELQNKFLSGTAENSYNEKYINTVTDNFYMLYSLVKELKEYEDLNKLAANRAN